MYMPDTPWCWRGFGFGVPFWLDCSGSDLPCAALFPGTTNIEYNGVSVNVATPVLVRDVFTGVTTITAPGSTDIIAQVAAPDGWYPGLWSEDRGVVYLFEQWTNSVDSLESWGEPEGGIIDPTVTLTVLLADAAGYDAYASNVAAAWEATCQSSDTAAAQPTLRAMAMDEEDDFSGDPCTITNEAVPFSVVSLTPDGGGSMVLQWQSCTDHVYIVQSESSLTPTSSWRDVAWMFGTDQQTTWTDTNAVGLSQQFYQVVRGSPNTLNNGIPYGWAVTYGLDPLDPNLASETSTNPWAHGLTNLQVYENPSVLLADNYSTLDDGVPDWWKVTYAFSLTDTNMASADPDGDGMNNLMEFLFGTDPNVFDPPLDVIVNGGNSCTASLTIQIQAAITNYPNLRVSTDPLMSNATVSAISGGMATYTLPDDGDGLYNVYVQYADAAGRPHSVVRGKAVTLDRTAPVVYITSPASNAVLDQAFITLQAVAADPNPVEPDEFRPLSISINGQPFWNRSGTNIVVKRFPVPAGSNLFTVTITAVDQAGNTNATSQTWTVDPSGDTTPPQLSSFNIATNTLLPDVSSVWVEGAVDDSNALVNAVVTSDGGYVTTNSMNVRDLEFEGSVPLDSGTNRVVFMASDAAGNVSSNLFSIIRSNRYRFEITSPAFGSFATAPSNYVSGYVSALFDEGLPTQTNVTSVFINGVAAVLGTNADAFGNIAFWTTNAIPLGVPITGFLAGPGIPTDPPPDPPMMSQEYEVISKSSVSNSFFASEGSPGAFRPSYDCGGSSWAVGVENDVQTNEYNLTSGSNSASVDSYVKSRYYGFGCTTDPLNDQSLWGGWGDFEYVGSSEEPVRSLSFGTSTPRGSDYPVGVDGWQHAVCCGGFENYWPWKNTVSASLTFTPPRQYDTDTTVILTFEGVSYARPNGVTQDLSQVKYFGQDPVSNDASSVSYLVTMNRNQTYTINQDSFQWPSFPTNSVEYDYGSFVYFSDTLHWLSFTNFHNHSPVHILWTNGVDITGTSGNSIIVGQQVNLQATVDTVGIATSNFTWSVSGAQSKLAISNYVIAADNSSAQVLPLVQTNKASISFYWVSGGQQNVFCSVLLNNGSVATSSAGFTVQQPHQTIGYINVQPTVDANYYDPQYPAPAYLHLGNPNPASPYGITFTRNGDSDPYGGSNYWSQVIVSTLTLWRLNNSTCLQFSAANSLDQRNPYNPVPDIANTWDAPGIPLLANYVEVATANSFCMYLMYTPPGANSISVPSAAVSWNWYGDAVQNSGVWSKKPGTVPVASVTADGPTNGFPAWTGVVLGNETGSPISCPP
jgi:hypothetical protein